jgi:uncharacterized protein (TIGR03000 family)
MGPVHYAPMAAAPVAGVSMGSLDNDAASNLLAETDDPSKIAHLNVVVHEKAIVTINGEPTFTKGLSRPYIVRGLQPGKNYKFVIQGLYKNEHGAEYFKEETITLEAGGSKQVVLQLRRRTRKPPEPQQPGAPAAPAAAAGAPAAK